MESFIAQLRLAQEQEILRIESSTDNDLKKWERLATLHESAIASIKECLQGYEFAGAAEEIDFFRNILPEFYGELIFHMQLLRIGRRTPEGGQDAIKEYYRRELARLTDYFTRHRDFYEYYRSGDTYLDDRYFLRHRNAPLDGEYYFIMDQSLCTIGCVMVSTILAHQSLSRFLTGQLEALDSHTKLQTPAQEGIQWTDSRAALEEMVYAWYFKGSFNKGQVKLRTLYEFVARCFGVQPANIFKSKQDFYGRSDVAAYQHLLLKRYKEGMEDSDERSSRS